MSLDTWKAEFYSTRACDTAEADAIDHSLTKWIGLRQENLERHSVWARSGGIVDKHGDRMQMYCENCSLCHHYYDRSLEDKYDQRGESRTCEACPLYKVRGMPCDSTSEEADLSPWDTWNEYSNPEPMIQLIEKAKLQFGDKSSMKE